MLLGVGVPQLSPTSGCIRALAGYVQGHRTRRWHSRLSNICPGLCRTPSTHPKGCWRRSLCWYGHIWVGWELRAVQPQTHGALPGLIPYAGKHKYIPDPGGYICVPLLNGGLSSVWDYPFCLLACSLRRALACACYCCPSNAWTGVQAAPGPDTLLNRP